MHDIVEDAVLDSSQHHAHHLTEHSALPRQDNAERGLVELRPRKESGWIMCVGYYTLVMLVRSEKHRNAVNDNVLSPRLAIESISAGLFNNIIGYLALKFMRGSFRNNGHRRLAVLLTRRIDR